MCRSDMKTITLTRGMSTTVDDDVYQWASRHSWFAGSGNNGRWYAARTVVRDGKKTTVYLHRLIAGVDGGDVDHWDGDSLNNTRTNLRPVTHKQNQENVRAGYGACRRRGVSMTPSGRYVAQAKVQGRHLNFGTYDTIDEAAEAARVGRIAVMTHSDGR